MITIVSEPAMILSARNPIAFQVHGEPEGDYYIAAKLLYESEYDSTELLELPTLIEYPDPEGNVLFDLSIYLNGLVEPDPGDITEVAITVMKKMRRKFKVLFEEWKDGIKLSEIDTDFRYVVRAGFSMFKGQLLENWIQDGNFLSHSPLNKWITPQQKEFLYFYMRKTFDSVQLKADYFFKDGSSFLDDIIFERALGQHEIVRVPAGFNQLDLASRPAFLGLGADDLQYYELFIATKIGFFSSSVQISKRIRYQVDTSFHPLRRYFYCENSLGGFDTFSTCGQASHKINTSGTRAQKMLNPLGTAIDHEFLDLHVRHQENFEQYVGFSNIDVQLWLRDLLRSARAYRIGSSFPAAGAEPNELIPINIDRGNTNLFKDNEFLNELKFSYTESAIHAGL